MLSFIKVMGGIPMHKVRNDIILIGVIFLFAIIGIILFQSFSKKDNLKAVVYVEDILVLEIPLEETKEYTIQGKVSEVKIRTSLNSICVIDSGCEDKICVHQGEIHRSHQTITCLPNRVYIKIIGMEGVDAVV